MRGSQCAAAGWLPDRLCNVHRLSVQCQIQLAARSNVLLLSVNAAAGANLLLTVGTVDPACCSCHSIDSIDRTAAQ